MQYISFNKNVIDSEIWQLCYREEICSGAAQHRLPLLRSLQREAHITCTWGSGAPTSHSGWSCGFKTHEYFKSRLLPIGAFKISDLSWGLYGPVPHSAKTQRCASSPRMLGWGIWSGMCQYGPLHTCGLTFWLWHGCSDTDHQVGGGLGMNGSGTSSKLNFSHL